MRRGHGRAVEVAVAARVAAGCTGGGQGAEDGRARRCQVHRREAPVGKAGLVVAVVARRYRDDVREVEIGRVRGDGVIVGAGVAGGGDEEDAAVALAGDGGFKRGRGRAAPAIVGDLDVVAPVVHHVGVVDRGNGAGHRPGVIRSEPADRQDLHARRDADHADSVIADGGDGARHVRAVPVLILRVVVVGEEIPAVDVVDEAVVVVVDAVAGDLAGIRIDVGGQVRVSEINAAVQHADDHRAAAGGDVPGLGSIDVRVGNADLPEDGLAGVVQAV